MVRTRVSMCSRRHTSTKYGWIRRGGEMAPACGGDGIGWAHIDEREAGQGSGCLRNGESIG